MLSIHNLNVSIDGRHILHDINYTQQLTGKLIGVLGEWRRKIYII